LLFKLFFKCIVRASTRSRGSWRSRAKRIRFPITKKAIDDQNRALKKLADSPAKNAEIFQFLLAHPAISHPEAFMAYVDSNLFSDGPRQAASPANTQLLREFVGIVRGVVLW
jgi:hypothetical protein